MGLFPCSLCFKRFRGPAQTVYPSALVGTQRHSAHLRLCPSCYEALLERLTANAVQLSLEGTEDQEVPLCFACAKPVDGTGNATLFATVYARGEDRQDFLGAAHPGCVEPLIEDLRLVSAA